MTGAALAVMAAGTAASTSAASSTSARQSSHKSTHRSAHANQTYYWIAELTSLQLFHQADLPALHEEARQLGVQVKVAGPTGNNLQALISTTEQVCALHPAGVMVMGFDPSQAASINQCIKEGVPVVTDDSDVPNSKRLSYVGSNWSHVGTTEAAQMKKLLPKGGEVALLSIVGSPIQDEATAAFVRALKGSKIKVVASENDGGVATTAQSAASQVLAAHPNLKGFATFDVDAGLGVISALRSVNELGKVKVVAMQGPNEYFKDMKKGWINDVIMQERALFPSISLQLLYDYHNSPIRVDGLPKTATPPIPARVIPGLVVVTPKNVNTVMKSLHMKA